MNKDVLQDFKEINKSLRREDKSLKNRLQSIIFDNQFLERQVFPTFNYPIIPNERCGLWYCNPSKYENTSYFKSTDGHVNQWDFSTRRLNFHLLPIIGREGGVIVLDSTRRGKKIPDALSKTVPIWCAVLNYLILEDEGKTWPFEEKILFVPPNTVPASEHDMILAKIPALVEKLKKIDIINAKKLKESLNMSNTKRKLLRPLWVYPGSSLLQMNHDMFTGEELTDNQWLPPDDIIPIILCTVSYQCQDGTDKRHGFTYVQGAADDHELWAADLTPQLFWENIDTLGDITKSDQELTEIYNDIISKKSQHNINNDTKDFNKLIQTDSIADDLRLGVLSSEISFSEDVVNILKQRYRTSIICDEKASKEVENIELPDNVHIYPLSSGSKKSSRDLRTHLISINALLKRSLATTNPKLPVLIACNNGKDMSVSVLIVALCLYYNLQWELEPQDSVNKTIIKKHLAKIIDSLHGKNVNPSRATLNSVNSFLM